MPTVYDLNMISLRANAMGISRTLRFETISFKKKQDPKHNKEDLVIRAVLETPLVGYNRTTACYHFVTELKFVLLLKEKKAYGGGLQNSKVETQKVGDCQVTAKQHYLPNIAVHDASDLAKFGLFFSKPSINDGIKLTSIKELGIEFNESDLLKMYHQLSQKKGYEPTDEINLVYL